MDDSPLYRLDLERTRAHRERLERNPNLRLWYRELYLELFGPPEALRARRVLEVGSGASPLKTMYPSVIASDVLRMDHLDLVFDCHRIAAVDAIPDRSLDTITMTNVLHHLRDPLAFLRDAAGKLADGGEVVAVEPYLSWLSTPLYRLLHPEPVDTSVARPVLDRVDGPLSTANQAIPWLIFFRRPDWLEELADRYDVGARRIGWYTGLAYMATGGIGRVLPVPGPLYRAGLALDRRIARAAPRAFASFFTVRLPVRRRGR